MSPRQFNLPFIGFIPKLTQILRHWQQGFQSFSGHHMVFNMVRSHSSLQGFMSMNSLCPHAPGRICAEWQREMIDFLFFYTPFPEASSHFTKTARACEGRN